MNCEIGDIVLVSKFEYLNGSKGSLHNFVVMDVRKDEFELVDLEYFCFLISSNINKNNDVNPKYPFNEPIRPTIESGLRDPGHVKCDTLFSIVQKDDIIMRVGTITPIQYTRFMELYKQSLNN